MTEALQRCEGLALAGMTTPQDPHDRLRSAPPPPPTLAYSGSLPPPLAGLAPGPPEAATARPKEVAISFWLWVVSFLIGLAVVAIIIGQYDTIRETVLQEASQAGEPQDGSSEAIATVVVATFVVVFLVVSAAQLLFALFMRKGRNWARIGLAVIGGVLLLVQLFSLPGTSGGELAFTLVSLAVLAGAVITMFLPGANPWFRPRPPGLTSG